MEANENTPTLFDVVKQYQKIEVDDYQRTYAWTKDEIEELFSDLKQCISDGDHHFFGTLILQAKDNSLATIVDGQQRLTTVFILVAALRDEILRLGIDTIQADQPGHRPIRVIDKTWNFLYPGDDLNVYRFHSNRFLRDIMQKSVIATPDAQQKLPERDSNLTLAFRKAIKTIRTLVANDLQSQDSKEQRLLRINAMLDAIMERFIVLRVKTTSMSESLEIFLTLNNRGLPLGPSDLVRGIVMSALGHAESEREQSRLHGRIFEEWKDISDNVREPEVFLRHYLVANSREKIQKKKVFDKVRDTLQDGSPDGRKLKARAFWDDLTEASEVYAQLIAPTMGGETQYRLELLDGLMKSHRIFLLTVLRSNLQDTDRDDLVLLTSILAFRWVMSGGNAQKLEDFFQKAGADLREFGDISKLKSSLEFEIKNIDFDVEKYLREEGDSSFVGRALLHAVNRHLTHGANPIALNGNLHLEHIAPQAPTPEWQSTVFSGNKEMFEDYDNLISELGNLTLLDVKLNLQAKRLPFDQKKSKYSRSTMMVTRDLVSIPKWTESEIQSRTKWLSEMFEAIWPKPGVVTPVIHFPDWASKQ